ncbi:16S rRNA (cytosine(967)-C(5))-methyltransferase RsmB [Permianibacter sp. IMCC34836]|uniref:16S rRNA (cytosine(967)-C(5))-methyltransferase RsmB n=1 Tax=Permianibacter fluminis TaxID=2738515 RepID=UPI0015578DE3|nr:16S rRNA (cytosine(967)-C(5))-methyltransferase RsmB [Permianibacter fluminis]NQD36066.1 16S rRNA (cytosine(967)-C(5))-methyltransferase RsmB [Permianibacter fluminis]
MNLRAHATELVTAVLKDGRSLNEMLTPAAQAFSDSRDRALLKELVYGSLRHFRRLAAVRDRLLSQALQNPQGKLANLLVVGLYQLMYTRIPAHAAVADTVNAVSDINEDRARGLVNAVLRSYQRKGETLLAQIDSDWGVQHSHPEWLVSAFKRAYGRDTEQLLAANNAPAPMTLRVNSRRGKLTDYQALLTALDIVSTAHPEARDALVLQTPMDVNQLPGFADGAVSVQDAAAQLAADYLDVQPGMRVLDACCAPGGKTAHLLERTPTAELLAIDNDINRLERVRETLARLQLQAELKMADAGEPASWWNQQPFDRILLDAPCSGTGVIRRHPDIKWLRRERDIPVLAAQQLKLLQALWPTLARGGKLLYATCSSLPAENAEVIAAFLAGQTDAELLPLPGHAGDRADRVIRTGEAQMDGFYYALLGKR